MVCSNLEDTRDFVLHGGDWGRDRRRGRRGLMCQIRWKAEVAWYESASELDGVGQVGGAC
jgi:hypothetical protein